MEQDKSTSADSLVMAMGRQAGIGMHLTSLPGDHGIGDIADAAYRFGEEHSPHRIQLNGEIRVMTTQQRTTGRRGPPYNNNNGPVSKT